MDERNSQLSASCSWKKSNLKNSKVTFLYGRNFSLEFFRLDFFHEQLVVKDFKETARFPSQTPKEFQDKFRKAVYDSSIYFLQPIQ
jgi:hypothetical protein